ncbi:MAG TPA: isoamylase early set domain-containing protein [Roseimicrobium sp.]|nr:isoamylase early set domain-containing protein [Roseimicrobium sp.]
MSLRRLPARKVEKPVNFSFIAPEAQTVSLAGDFNGWDPEATPMRRMPDGGWTAQVTLPHGHHRYLFVVDGEAMLDPRANGTSTDENDYTFSLIAVS